LATKFPLILVVAALILIKEVFMAISGYMVVKKCNIVLAAEWYGKLSTVIITAMMVLHLFWPKLNPILSNVSIIIAALSVLMALVLYAIRNFGYLNSVK
jgi:cardiolipin synthase